MVKASNRKSITAALASLRVDAERFRARLEQTRDLAGELDSDDGAALRMHLHLLTGRVGAGSLGGLIGELERLTDER